MGFSWVEIDNPDRAFSVPALANSAYLTDFMTIFHFPPATSRSQQAGQQTFNEHR
jgi:hypothetical protein